MTKNELSTDLIMKIGEQIKNQKIIEGVVDYIAPVEGERRDKYMTVVFRFQNRQLTGIIPAEEADAELDRRNLSQFWGRTVIFTISNVKDGAILCSRKEAQMIRKAELAGEVGSDRIFEAEIMMIPPQGWGAFVDFCGISAILYNRDFAEDFSRVGDIYKIGDKINVKILDVNSEQRISVGAAVKYRMEELPAIEEIQINSVVGGTVIDIKQFSENGGVGCFVRLERHSVDALCRLPEEPEVEKGCRVGVRIQSVEPGDDKRPVNVKGSIVRVLD